MATGSQQQSRRGRRGWGIFSVLRALLALEGGARQSELVDFANVIQPRISQALSEWRQLIWSNASLPVGS